MKPADVPVLVLDQVEGQSGSLISGLARQGFPIVRGADLKRVLASLAGNPDQVVVIDLDLDQEGSGSTGLEALRRIREAAPGAEVILLTRKERADRGVAGLRLGAFDYLTTPLEADHLAEKILQAADKIHWREEEAREEEFRSRIEQRMDAAERLASLGTLAAGVAHEINNPLAIISEAAGWLKSRLDKSGPVPEELKKDLELALEKIEAGLRRVKRITHQLINTTVRPETRIKEFDLKTLVDEVIELTRKMADSAGVRVERKSEIGESVIWSDPFQIRQVLINLVNNGLQAVDRGGRVEIVIQGDEKTARILVADDGPGIPPENLDRIFEPFFSTKPPGEGTGLGLSVSRGIAENLGGSLVVESELGQGATFTLTLPRVAEELGEGGEKSGD